MSIYAEAKSALTLVNEVTDMIYENFSGLSGGEAANQDVQRDAGSAGAPDV